MKGLSLFRSSRYSSNMPLSGSSHDMTRSPDTARRSTTDHRDHRDMRDDSGHTGMTARGEDMMRRDHRDDDDRTRRSGQDLSRIDSREYDHTRSDSRRYGDMDTSEGRKRYDMSRVDGRPYDMMNRAEGPRYYYDQSYGRGWDLSGYRRYWYRYDYSPNRSTRYCSGMALGGQGRGPNGTYNRRGNAYFNWINSLRSNYVNAFERRRREEFDDEKPVSPNLNKVDRVHWYIRGNAKTHNTMKYDLVHDKKEQKPVMRRGQDFYLALRFRDRDFDIKKDRVVLNFKFGAKPSVHKGTMAVIPIWCDKFTRSKEDWDVRIDSGSRGKDLVLQVFIPANAPVGIWRLDVCSGLQDRNEDPYMYVYSDETDAYILFNPWCKDDPVYMDDEDKRYEYVMNDKGKVYMGAYKSRHGRPWAFGQFDDVVLPVACYIMELSSICDTERGNPVRVCKAISSMVCRNNRYYDDDSSRNDPNNEGNRGVMMGRWDDEYHEGVAPFKWTGTVRILEEYLKSGYRPVKYGQCWIFSAVVTTICRTLGIPCRSVTNYVSAHDTNSSLSIDKFFDRDGSEVQGGPDGENWDSVWFFHVWNDVWMRRMDLPKGYGGWQAIDATPQEEGDHKYQCGPASLEAIRKGDIGFGYDSPHIFSQVNADIIHWGEDWDSDWGWRRMKIYKYHVGRSILTKRPGKDEDFGETDREDVVHEYKSRAGTETENRSVHRAIRGYQRGYQYHEFKRDCKEDVTFELHEVEKIEIGDPFQIKVVVRNDSSEHRTITVGITAHSMYYTGVQHATLKKSDGKFQLGPKQQQDVVLGVNYVDYWQKMVEGCMIKVYTVCYVQETSQSYTEEEDFILEKPKLDIKVCKEGMVRQPCQATFTFKNPLDIPLTECQLSVDGAGLMRPRAFMVEGEVKPNGQFSYTMTFQPLVHGERKIIACFNSKELYDIHGGKTFWVNKYVAQSSIGGVVTTKY